MNSNNIIAATLFTRDIVCLRNISTLHTEDEEEEDDDDNDNNNNNNRQLNVVYTLPLLVPNTGIIPY